MSAFVCTLSVTALLCILILHLLLLLTLFPFLLVLYIAPPPSRSSLCGRPQPISSSALRPSWFDSSRSSARAPRRCWKSPYTLQLFAHTYLKSATRRRAPPSDKRREEKGKKISDRDSFATVFFCWFRLLLSFSFADRHGTCLLVVALGVCTCAANLSPRSAGQQWRWRCAARTTAPLPFDSIRFDRPFPPARCIRQPPTAVCTLLQPTRAANVR